MVCAIESMDVTRNGESVRGSYLFSHISYVVHEKLEGIHTEY